jgi:hypothetical protein
MTKPTGRPRGRPKTKEYVTLMARVPQELANRVQRYAGLHQQSISVVLRDALEVLLEEDRYQPFLSDRNTESAHIMSDMKETQADIVPDRNGDTSATRAVRPPRGRSKKVSDMKAARTEISSDRKGDERTTATRAPLPAMVSDAKAVETASTPEPAILSDTNAPAFDPSKYVLGKLCPRGHDYHGTGQSLRRLPRFVCLECDAEAARERRQAQRKATQR